MLTALTLAITLAANLEPVPPDALHDGRLAVAPLHGSARCELPGGEWQQLVDGGAVKGWVCTDGQLRLGIMPQATAPAKMSDADAERMLAGAASRVPAGSTLTDKGWARETLPAGEAVRIWVAMKGPDGVTVMHSIYLPGEPAIGFVLMSHTDSTASPEALVALARSYTRAP